MAFLFQLCSLFGFTIGNSLWHKPAKALPISFIIALKSLITSILFLLITFIALQFKFSQEMGITQSVSRINATEIFYAIGLCGISFWGLYFFNQSLKHTASGITITVVGSGTIIGFLTAFFIYNERITAANIISSVIATFGLWCLEKLNPHFFRLKLTKGMLFGLMSMFFWRIGALFPLSINKTGVLLFSIILESTVFLISFSILILSKKYKFLELKEVKSNFVIIVLIALTNFVGILGNHLSLKFSSMVTYTILGFLGPVVTFFMSLFVYKEKYSKIQYLGISLIIFGGFALNSISAYFKS